jgi:hypothetical protein
MGRRNVSAPAAAAAWFLGAAVTAEIPAERMYRTVGLGLSLEETRERVHLERFQKEFAGED